MSLIPFRLPDDAEARFAVVERHAIMALERGRESVPAGRVPSFRLWHYPPAGPWTSWMLFVPRGFDFRDGPAILRELRWDADGDRERVLLSPRRRPSLDPSLRERQSEMGNEAIEGLLRRASRLLIGIRELKRLTVSPTLTEYGIEGYRIPSMPDRVEWESPVPVGLGTVAAWHAWARKLFDGALQGAEGLTTQEEGSASE